MNQTVRGCGHLLVNHCISCHEDEMDWGYGMSVLSNWDLDWEAEVCCSVKLAIDGVDALAKGLAERAALHKNMGWDECTDEDCDYHNDEYIETGGRVG